MCRPHPIRCLPPPPPARVGAGPDGHGCGSPPGGIRGGSASPIATAELLSDVITNVTSPAPCTPAIPCPTVFNDTGTITLRAPLKDVGTSITTLAPSTNNEVTVNRYRVEYTRTDGRNVQGVDVPFAWDGAVTGTILIIGAPPSISPFSDLPLTVSSSPLTCGPARMPIVPVP